MNCQSHVFNAFDCLILSVLAFSLMLGWMRGFVREALGLGAWGGSAWISVQKNFWPQDFWGRWIKDPEMIRWACISSLFFGSLILFLTISQVVSHYVEGTILKSANNALGLVFGVVRGVMLVIVFYVASLFIIAPQDQPLIVHQSRSIFWLNKAAIMLAPPMKQFLSEKSPFVRNVALLQQDLEAAQTLPLGQIPHIILPDSHTGNM